MGDRRAECATKVKQKHKHLLPVIGAGIILLTFVVKETVRDNLRDLVGSIDTAQQGFELESQLNRILLAANMRPREIQIRDLEGAVKTDIDDATAYFAFTSSALRSAEKLVDKLPENPKQRKQLMDLEARLGGLDDERKKIQLQNGFVRTTFPDAQSLIRPAALLLSNTASLMNDVTVFQLALLKDAKDLRDYRDKWFTFTTRASYLLYFVGWLLALLSKIYGADAGPEQ